MAEMKSKQQVLLEFTKKKKSLFNEICKMAMVTLHTFNAMTLSTKKMNYKPKKVYAKL